MSEQQLEERLFVVEQSFDALCGLFIGLLDSLDRSGALRPRSVRLLFDNSMAALEQEKGSGSFAHSYIKSLRGDFLGSQSRSSREP